MNTAHRKKEVKEVPAVQGERPRPQRAKPMTQTRLRTPDKHLLTELDTIAELVQTLAHWIPNYPESAGIKNELPESMRCVWSKCESRMVHEKTEGTFDCWRCTLCGAIVNLDYPGG